MARCTLILHIIIRKFLDLLHFSPEAHIQSLQIQEVELGGSMHEISTASASAEHRQSADAWAKDLLVLTSLALPYILCDGHQTGRRGLGAVSPSQLQGSPQHFTNIYG